MYEEFLERNPTFEARVDAFTSGILSPDAKALTLWAMEHGKPYTRSALYQAVLQFAGRGLPVTEPSVWQYCNGVPARNRRDWYDGALCSIGAVVKDKIVVEGGDAQAAYLKTDAGADFGEPLAALATALVNRMDSAKKKPRFISMQRIISMPNTRGKHSHGYAVYRIIKLLAENQGKELGCADITEQTGLNETVVSYTLTDLGKAGMIEYYSPKRDVGGSSARGWSVVRIDESIRGKDPENAYRDARALRKGFYSKGYFLRVFEYCQSHVGEE
ncbi:MAG: helix-turn-helix transcriptional regulator, partial [Candidatus Aenigmarchaeota archaeon]|nr:helix-turn-helix transcriptional regulator [Candidatus Aenigmarchaeota archaeon]